MGKCMQDQSIPNLICLISMLNDLMLWNSLHTGKYTKTTVHQPDCYRCEEVRWKHSLLP